MASLLALKNSLVAKLTPAVGEREARAMTELILEDVARADRVAVALNPDRVVEPETERRATEIADRVVAGEPLQYILGHASFYGLTLTVRPGVLIPRPETAGLVDLIVHQYDGQPDLRILDACTGSGCIALALARTLPFCQVTAVDISPVALELTKENANALKAGNVEVVECDVLNQPLPTGPYDIVVSNPPYVDLSERADMDARVLDHEPALALFVPDDDPLLFYRNIAKSALAVLRPGGRLYFEINPRHAAEVVDLLTTLGYTDVTTERDFTGRVRFVVGSPSQPPQRGGVPKGKSCNL